MLQCEWDRKCQLLAYSDGFEDTYNVLCENHWSCSTTKGRRAKTLPLTFTLPAWAVPTTGAKLQLIYDIHGVNANISVLVNGQVVVTRLPTLKDSVLNPSATYGGFTEWSLSPRAPFLLLCCSYADQVVSCA
jgi:hypothetical protein